MYLYVRPVHLKRSHIAGKILVPFKIFHVIETATSKLHSTHVHRILEKVLLIPLISK